MIAALVLIFVGLFIIGSPIAVALGATSLFNAEVFHTISLTAFTKVASNGFNSYLLVACPLFTFAGDIMAKGGISSRLIKVAKLFFDDITGGLGIVAIIACMIFAAISGTGSATVSAIGTMIPPAYVLVVYATTAGVSLTSMFTAGIPAGILFGLALIFYCYLSAKKRGYVPELVPFLPKITGYTV